MFTGKLELRPWSKSEQSYCAQGSEYYVLIQANGEEIVIRNDSGQDLAPFEGKDVQVQGTLETKTIKPPQNNFSQQIVAPRPRFLDGSEDIEAEEPSFTCTVLAMQQIK
jgi:hypothetical protein